MGLFKKKNQSSTDKSELLGWLAFAVSVLSWLLQALEKFPKVPAKPGKDETTDKQQGG